MIGIPPTLHTTPPGRFVLLYDGHCRFCQSQALRLTRLAAKGAIETRSFHDDGVLDQFPNVSHEMCMQAMQLVSPEGIVYSGMEAAARALATRPVIGLPALIYYLPGLRQVSDEVYRWIAANRYRFGGSMPESCDNGACPTHSQPQAKSHHDD